MKRLMLIVALGLLMALGVVAKEKKQVIKI